MLESVSLFFLIAGFVLGLGAVTVIDMHGFFARNSSYWTEATIRTHKITKPLIWAGMITVLIAGSVFYLLTSSPSIFLHIVLSIILIANGCFLSFVVSPDLLQREKEGRARELLPDPLQKKIRISFMVSFAGWWSLVALLVISLV